MVWRKVGKLMMEIRINRMDLQWLLVMAVIARKGNLGGNLLIFPRLK
jgi:hypothetical protein